MVVYYSKHVTMSITQYLTVLIFGMISLVLQYSSYPLRHGSDQIFAIRWSDVRHPHLFDCFNASISACSDVEFVFF